MSSGNPMGLSEISHFGTFQRVGGKAGGFISKKFFHPSSFRNQEKLWKAQTADERDTRQQAELEKRRDEERQVEAIKKQMYLAGQGKATDFLPSSSSTKEEERDPAEVKKSEQKTAVEEENRRRAMLKRQNREGGQAAAPARGSSSAVKLAASSYPEDVLVLGHQAVWGSWYSMEEKRWGFSCCRVLERDRACPSAEAEEAEDGGSAKASSSTKSRKKEGGADSAAAASASSRGGAQEEGGLQPRGGGARGQTARGRGGDEGTSGTAAAKGDEALLDPRLLAAAEERKSGKRKAEAELKEQGKTSSYLAVLMRDPGNK